MATFDDGGDDLDAKFLEAISGGLGFMLRSEMIHEDSFADCVPVTVDALVAFVLANSPLPFRAFPPGHEFDDETVAGLVDRLRRSVIKSGTFLALLVTWSQRPHTPAGEFVLSETEELLLNAMYPVRPFKAAGTQVIFENESWAVVADETQEEIVTPSGRGMAFDDAGLLNTRWLDDTPYETPAKVFVERYQVSLPFADVQ